MTDYTAPFSKRSAFLLNANARAATASLIQELREVIPAGDIFLSTSLDDAEKYARVILSRGYERVFTGGGDGTVMSTISLLKKMQKEHGGKLPYIGVLKLGTGNAMAVCVGAEKPVHDAYHIVQQGALRSYGQYLIENAEGEYFPFAGIGYDAQVINDYNTFKDFFKDTFLKKITSSLFGYVLAAVFITAPRIFIRSQPKVRIYSRNLAYRMISEGKNVRREEIAAGTLIYEGKASFVSVGSIPFFGYGIRMFPFLKENEAMMQLRVSPMGVLRVLKNFYPGFWSGSFRDKDLHDFLLKDVQIEFDREVDYQVGGDARAYKKRVDLQIAPKPIKMLQLENRIALPKKLSNNGLFLGSSQT